MKSSDYNSYTHCFGIDVGQLLDSKIDTKEIIADAIASSKKIKVKKKRVKKRLLK